jgi:NADH-quinone oxidoreductase subunit A
MDTVPGTYLPAAYLPIVVLCLVAALIGFTPLLIGLLVRPQRPYFQKLLPYESGNPPIGEPRYKFSVKFYIIAMLFVVFDVEVVFLYPWAVAFDRIGLYGFIEMTIFVLFLLIGYLYVWRKGAFHWD